MILIRKAVPGLSQRALSRYVTAARRAVGLVGEVDVLLAGNAELRALNFRFRRKNKSTDVLSFPATVNAADLAGDIAISVQIAAQNGRRLGHTTGEEVKILILHGILHLAEYDHENDHGEMAREEQRLRKRLGLPVGLIERNVKPSGQAKSRGRKGRGASRSMPGNDEAAARGGGRRKTR